MKKAKRLATQVSAIFVLLLFLFIMCWRLQLFLGAKNCLDLRLIGEELNLKIERNLEVFLLIVCQRAQPHELSTGIYCFWLLGLILPSLAN